MHIPENVQYILDQLHKNGHEAYIVGGCVRDMILGIEPHDYDITTSAFPEVVKSIFGRTIDTGIEHGTVTIMIDKEGYEVTTYRIDGEYKDNRRPESVEFTGSLEEDLKRRDFTINAMAYNEEEGIIDLFNGQEDLRAGVVRCVGKATERFTEDALRMMRAIRFAARFGYDIEAETASAISQLCNLIEHISAERIHMELSKTLCSIHPEYVEMFVTFGLIDTIMPEFKPCVGLAQNHPYHIYDVDKHTYECLKHIEADEALRWAIYLHDIGKGYTKSTDDQGVDHFYGHPRVSVELSEKILKRLKFDNKTKKRVMQLIDFHDYRFENTLKSVRKAMAKMGSHLFLDYLAVQRADIMGQSPDKETVRLEDLDLKEALYKEVLRLEQCVTVKGLAISGKELMDLGIPRGTIIGAVLNHMLQLVIEDPSLNTTETLVKEAKIYLSERGIDGTE